MNNLENKKLPVWLIIGIVLVPLVFAWFTLRQGYSRKARTVSFAWLVVSLLFVAVLPTPPASTTPIAEKQKNAQVVVEPKKVDGLTAETVPANVEENIGMTPEEFRKKFNAELKKHDISFIRPLGEFDIRKGDVRDSFLVQFSDDLGMTGTVNKDGMLREVIFIMTNSNPNENPVPSMFVVTGTTSNVLSNNSKEGTDSLVDLIKKSMEGMNDENNTHSKIIGNIKYYALASPELGLWVGVSPAKE